MTKNDQWSLKQKINSLENSIQKLNQKIPRTKFRFKRKRETQEKQKTSNSQDAEKQDEFTRSVKGLVDLKNQTITLKQADLDGNFKLVNLENCIIRFEGLINMLFLRNLKNCEVYSCPVSNSIMGHNLLNSKISIIGHQVRASDPDTAARLLRHALLRLHHLETHHRRLLSSLLPRAPTPLRRPRETPRRLAPQRHEPLEGSAGFQVDQG